MAANVSFYRGCTVPPECKTDVLRFTRELSASVAAGTEAAQGLGLEAVPGAQDKRVHTAVVADGYAVVLFHLQGTNERQFLIVDVLPSDAAVDYARRLELQVNPVSGVTQLVIHEEMEGGQPSDVEPPEPGSADGESSGGDSSGVEPAGSDAAGGGVAAVLGERGIDKRMLESDLGLSAVTIAALWDAESADAAREAVLALDKPSWELHAALDVLAGMSIDEVRADLGLDSAEGDMSAEEAGSSEAGSASAETEDDRLLAGMRTDGARMDFALDVGEDQLADVLSHGSFDDWRVFLHPNQRRAVTANHAGSARVAGGAGTGKTVVVVHRTKYLMEKDPQARVLLTTYTRELANSLKTQMNLVDPTFNEAAVKGAPGLWISGIDALVADVLRNAQDAELHRGLVDNFGIDRVFVPKGLGSRQENGLWQDAVDLVGEDLPPEKANPTFLSQEYSTIILTHGVTEERRYLRMPRRGRGTPLSRRERKVVWKILQVFHSKCEAAGRLPFAANAVLAADIVSRREGDGMFDHVLVDEAQDFHAGHWRFLRAVVSPGPNDIFLAEDSHQRIYGQKLTLANYGISTRGRASTKLRLNYRTTAQNLGYASAILDGVEWTNSDDERDDLHGYHSVRQGPAPEVLRAGSKNEEARLVAERIQGWLRSGPAVSVGVLTRTNQRKSEVENQLAELDIPVSTGRRTSDEKPVAVMTMHNAKGLEFTHVVLMGVNADVLPQRYQLRGLADAERDDALQRERALLYVAASRARDVLVVSTVGEPSELLPGK